MKLTKPQAIKWLKNNEFIDLCPCKLWPYGTFRPSVRIFREHILERCKEFNESFEEVFNDILRNFEYYNCSNETGRYIHFYTGE